MKDRHILAVYLISFFVLGVLGYGNEENVNMGLFWLSFCPILFMGGVVLFPVLGLQLAASFFLISIGPLSSHFDWMEHPFHKGFFFIGFVNLLILIGVYFLGLKLEDRSSKNPFRMYVSFRTYVIFKCKRFFDDLFGSQKVAPGTFYGEVLYCELPIYQKTLNEIMQEVFGNQYDMGEKSISPRQREQIIEIARRAEYAFYPDEHGESRGIHIKQGYVWTMLHQYLRLASFFRGQENFSDWADTVVSSPLYNDYAARGIWDDIKKNYQRDPHC